MGVIYTVFGIISVLSGIISTLLNPISFYYHFIKKSISSTRLYCLLAAADFATNLIFPFFLAYHFLSDRPQDNIGFRSVTTTEMIAIAMFDVPAFIAGNIIAIVRFIAIKYPFYMIRNKLLFSYLFAVFLLFCIRCMLDVFSDSLEWCPVFEYAIPINLGNTTYSKIHSRLSDVAYYLFTSFSVLGCIASIGTIILVLMRKIRRKSLTQNTVNAKSVEVLKDGIRIFLMVLFANVLPPILQIMFITYFLQVMCSVSHSFFMVTSILAISVSPIISSALDPVIVILFSDAIKKFLKEKIDFLILTSKEKDKQDYFKVF